MSERNSPTDRIERRGFLAAVAAGLGGVGATQGSAARESMGRKSTARYVVEQGDRCLPIVPFSGDETVAEFYDYRTPFTDPSGPAYSSYGTTDLQRPDTSILFLYDGPEGLSLVVVHDKLEDGTNDGAVTFRFENLTGGEWVVGDDIYDAPSNYDRFRQTDTGWQVDWTWTESRSDGGAYRPLGDDFTVTIDPGFNADAALYGDPYEGEITEWQALSGNPSNPDRRSLSLDAPITIRAGGCGGSGGGGGGGDDNEADASPTDADVSVVQGRVNPRSRGMLPVVVHSTSEFDATTLDLETVAFGPSGANPAKSTVADVNDDGRADLLLKFRLPATGIDWDTETADLLARTEDGREVRGTADIRLVPRGGDDGDEEDEEDEENEENEEDEQGERSGDDDDQEDGENEDDEENDDDDKDDEDERHDRRRSDEGREKGGNGKRRGHDKGNGRERGKERGEGRERDDDE